MLQANYSKPGSGTNINNYKEWLSYDKNGNIADIIRSGNIDPVSGTVENIIDELHFAYDTNNKNLLMKVDDASNSPQGFKDNYASSGDDYTYDLNGNMTKDKNKDIEFIMYNHLNLPTYIEFSGTTNGTISYIYNAVGQKVKKIVNEGSPINTEYFGGFQYEDAILQFFPHAEGYVKTTGITGRTGVISYYEYNYVFNYTDHLGNIRVSYAYDPNMYDLKILEENHYYPFGLKHKNYNIDKLDFGNFPETGVEIVPTENPMYKYKYNGQELQEELGLNMTAMDYRQYDSAIGRFNSMDALSEKAYYITPYRFALNNPVFWGDPTGLSEETNLAHCPTCPKTPEFKPLIDDPNTEYIYDPETKTASTLIEDVVVVGEVNENKESNFVSNGKTVNDYFGLFTSPLELFRSPTFRLTNSKRIFDPKFYSNGWNGNQYVKPLSVFKTIGWLGFGVGTFLDYQGVKNYNNPKIGPKSDNSVHPNKAKLNAGVALYGLLINPIPSIFYSGIDTFYNSQNGNGKGWEGAMKDAAQTQAEFDRVINQNSGMTPQYIFPYGSQKF